MRGIVILLMLICASNVDAQINIITTIAGKDSAGYSGDNGPATNAELNVPEYICLDKSGNIYVADGFNQRIRKISISNGFISTIAGNGATSYNGDNISATDAALFVPSGVCTDTFGNIFVADPGNNRIRKVSLVTGVITTVAGIGPVGILAGGSSGDGGIATNAELNGPCGLAIDKAGNIYIGDYCNNKVRRVDASTGIITTFAGTEYPSYAGGFIGYSGDGGPATDAVLSGPIQIFVDSASNVYICDQWNHAIRRVDIATGTIKTIAGKGVAGHSGDNGPATAAELNQPCGMDMDRQGNIFIADYGDGTIRRVDGATGIITTVAGNDTLGFSGDGGPATNAKLRCGDVHVDKYGTIYIADEDNNRIRKVYNPKLAVPNETPQAGMIKLFPNPAGNELHIIYDLSSQEAGTFQLFDITGRSVMSSVLAADRQKEILNIRDLVKGVYLFKVFQQDKVLSSGELIKE